jgi:hypothetical protein
MKASLLLLTASAVWMTGGADAQPPQSNLYQTVLCIKVTPGKTAEFRQLVNDATKPMMQARANAGEFASWTFLRSVMPAGSGARCDYSFSTVYEGIPPAPDGPEALPKWLEKAGVKMSAAQYLAKRDSVSHLVSRELWRPRIRVGTPLKGNYAYVNYMKVHDMPGFAKFENEVWRPMAEGWIKDGSQTGWIFSTALLPGGTDVKYAAYTADIYPNWAEVFKTRSTEEMFKKVHPGKDLQQTFAPQTKLRDLAERHLVVVEDRVAKK